MHFVSPAIFPDYLDLPCAARPTRLASLSGLVIAG
jgi:hypothetical protein